MRRVTAGLQRYPRTNVHTNGRIAALLELGSCVYRVIKCLYEHRRTGFVHEQIDMRFYMRLFRKHAVYYG